VKAIFFSNGCTAFFKNNKQVPELQEPWVSLYFEFLVSKGIDPEKCEFELPNGKKVKAFKTDDNTFNCDFE